MRPRTTLAALSPGVRRDGMTEARRNGGAGRLGRMRAFGIALLVLCRSTAAFAADEGPSPWEFEFEPYGWIPGTFGSVAVDGHTAYLDVTAGDVLDAVFDGDALAAAGYFSVRRDRWSAFVDVFGGGAKVDIVQTIPTPFCDLSVDAKDTLRFVIADFALGYRLGQWSLPKRRRPLTIGVYAGARYVHLGNDLGGGVGVIGGRQFSGDVSDTVNWADPIIGLRWSVPVLDAVTLDFRGDIGGFGASSDLDWGLVADARYWLSWTLWSARPYLAAGYRLVAFDRSESSDSVDMQLRGPIVGMGFVF